MKFLILFFICISCTLPSKHKDLYSTINVNENNNENADITINKNKNSKSTTDSNKPKEIRKVTLTLLPTLYNSLAIIDLLQNLEKEEVTIGELHSFGFGSLVLCLYAKEKSASYLEWHLFRLVKNIKNLRPYEKKWKDALLGFAKNEFKTMKISELKINVKPLVRDVKELYQDQSELTVVDFLKKSLDLENENGFFNSKLDYIEERNENLKYTIAYIGEPVLVSKLNGLHFGIYTQYLGRLMNSNFTNDGIYVMRATTGTALDEVSSTSELSNFFNEKNKEMLNTIVSDINSDKVDQDADYYSY